MSFRPTQRTYKNIDNNEVFRLYMHNEKHSYRLISETTGNTINDAYLCAFTPITIKLNTGKVVSLSTGEFYSLRDSEQVTHKMFCGFKRFTKV